MTVETATAEVTAEETAEEEMGTEEVTATVAKMTTAVTAVVTTLGIVLLLIGPNPNPRMRLSKGTVLLVAVQVVFDCAFYVLFVLRILTFFFVQKKYHKQ